MFAYQRTNSLSDHKYLCSHEFYPSTKNKIGKSPCFGDRKLVAISVAWPTRLLYFITALSASLNAYMSQSGSCCIFFLPTHFYVLYLQYSSMAQNPTITVIWPAVGLSGPHLFCVFELPGQIWTEWTAGGWTGYTRPDDTQSKQGQITSS